MLNSRDGGVGNRCIGAQAAEGDNKYGRKTVTPRTKRIWKRRRKKNKPKKKNGKDSNFEYYKLETFPSFSLEVRSWEDSGSYCEVNRARHMPQNHFVVEYQDTGIEVYIWDVSKHPSFPTDNEGNGDVGESPFAPQGVCV